jgi:hypothetical protein
MTYVCVVSWTMMTPFVTPFTRRGRAVRAAIRPLEAIQADGQARHVRR